MSQSFFIFAHEAKRLKFLLDRNDGGAWGEDPDGSGDTYLVLRSTDQLVDGTWNIVDPAIRKLSKSDFEKTRLLNGDLVITKSSGSQDHIGKTSIVTKDMEEIGYSFSNFMQRLRVKKNIDPRFVAYIFNSDIGRTQFRLLTNSTTGLGNLTGDVFGEILSPAPSFAEQRAISDYLDRETAHVDSLIVGKKRLLELLAEKRSTIINQAVTNGNAANSIQKDKTPAPWLFPLPSGWSRQPLKHISFTKGRIGYEELKAEEYTDEGPYLVSSAHFRDGKVEWERCNHVTRERFEMAPDIILCQHDVLFMKDGAAMGKLAYINDLPGDACLNSHILVIRPLQESYLPKFLFYVLMTDVFKAYMEQERKGTTFFGFSEQSMGNFPMSFPSLSEQKEIVSSLEDKIEKIDRLAVLANKTNEHLYERRVSLIAAAVSGQIKIT